MCIVWQSAILFDGWIACCLTDKHLGLGNPTASESDPLGPRYQFVQILRAGSFLSVSFLFLDTRTYPFHIRKRLPVSQSTRSNQKKKKSKMQIPRNLPPALPAFVRAPGRRVGKSEQPTNATTEHRAHQHIIHQPA